MRLIDADAIPWQHGKDGDVIVYPDIIAQMSTIEPERTGKWIVIRRNKRVMGYKCSECGRTVYDDTGYVAVDFPYCHCGCKMEVDDNGKQ